LEIISAAYIVALMKWLKIVAVFGLLALWLPATNHCRLETIPGLEFLCCASDTDSSSDCDGDGCDVVERGFYKSENDRPIVPTPDFVVALSLTPLLGELLPLAPSCGVEFTSAPPELPKVWQFFFRTALLPRAPSIAS
jgi:hypothetical protein